MCDFHLGEKQREKFVSELQRGLEIARLDNFFEEQNLFRAVEEPWIYPLLEG